MDGAGPEKGRDPGAPHPLLFQRAGSNTHSHGRRNLPVHTRAMPPTRQRRARSRAEAGVVAVMAALLCGATLFTPLVRADVASTVGVGIGASNDLPPAKGSGLAGAGLAGGPPPPPPSTAAPAELTATTLAPALAALPPTQPVLLEFYAHWCPTCRRFQPEYEAAAAGLASGGGGPRVFVARLDCANDVSFFCGHWKKIKTARRAWV